VNNVGLYKHNDNIYLHEYWAYTVNKLPVNKSYLLSNFLTRLDQFSSFSKTKQYSVSLHPDILPTVQ